MEVVIEDEQSDLSIVHPQVQKIVKEVLSFEGVHCDEVCIHFVGVKNISDLHAEYFDDPSPTDCITFPLDPPKPSTGCGQADFSLLGDVFVCPKVAIDYSATHHLDPYEETTLYVIHGLLHLLGYDDTSPEVESKMRLAEQRHFANLSNKNLLLTR